MFPNTTLLGYIQATDYWLLCGQSVASGQVQNSGSSADAVLIPLIDHSTLQVTPRSIPTRGERQVNLYFYDTKDVVQMI